MLYLARLSHPKQASFIFRCPGCRSNETEHRRDKGYSNSKLGSQGVVIFAICKFERSDLSANSPNALHAYLLISILSIPVDPILSLQLPVCSKAEYKCTKFSGQDLVNRMKHRFAVPRNHISLTFSCFNDLKRTIP